MVVKTLKTSDSKVLHPARDSHTSCLKTAQEGQRKCKGPNTARNAMKHCHKHDLIKAIMISHQNGLEQTEPVKQQQQVRSRPSWPFFSLMNCGLLINPGGEPELSVVI